MSLRITGILLLAALAIAACGKEKGGMEGRNAPFAASATVSTGATSTATAPEEMEVADLKADAPDVITIAVPSMQKGCGSCKKNVSEAVAAVPAVAAYGVDNEARFVRVRLSRNTPQAKAAVESAIARAGYSTDNVKRDSAAYARLPECCKDQSGHAN